LSSYDKKKILYFYYNYRRHGRRRGYRRDRRRDRCRGRRGRRSVLN
jgi:hypothetical protein